MKHMLLVLICLSTGLSFRINFAKSVREVITEKNIQIHIAPSDFGFSPHVVLNLNAQDIDDLDGLTEVPGVENITSLYLFLNNISHFPAELLADPHLMRLKKINLMRNPIADDKGAIDSLKAILVRRGGTVLY